MTGTNICKKDNIHPLWGVRLKVPKWKLWYSDRGGFNEQLCCWAQVAVRIREISVYSHTNIQHLTSATQIISKTLNICYLESPPEWYLNRFCYNLDLPFKVEKKATQMFESFKKLQLKKKPQATSLAAISIYLSAVNLGYELSLPEIAIQTDVTLRSLFNQLEKIYKLK